jgi:hypothetical protein
MSRNDPQHCGGFFRLPERGTLVPISTAISTIWETAVYIYDVRGGGIYPSPSTYQDLKLRFSADHKKLSGGSIRLKLDPSDRKEVYEGYMGVTGPNRQSLFTWNIRTCAGIVYSYSKDGEFRGAALIHATTTFEYKDGSNRLVDGPIAEAKLAGINDVRPEEVGVIIAAGEDSVGSSKGKLLREKVKEFYAPILTKCEKEGLKDDQIIIYASPQLKLALSFGISSDGRVGESPPPTTRSSAEPIPTLPKKGCCYLATAACSAAGLSDNCQELTLLRWYRDSVLAMQWKGQRDIEDYYATAPTLVARIDSHPDRLEIYDWIYNDGVCPAARAIGEGKFEQAYGIYRSMHSALCRRLLGVG